ncbi:hypothetical protein TNCV_3922711 [Trichonephila clavipes]|nr:hypothetical protein TNCV_3922711 [Trichonephila clavipes]
MVLFRNVSWRARHAGWNVKMMDLRSSRVLRPRQFQEIKEVIKSSHLLLARSQKTKSCGRPGLSGMKLCLMFFTFGMMTQRTAPGKTGTWSGVLNILRTFGLVRWGLGGSGHVEGTGEKLSFASQAAR